MRSFSFVAVFTRARTSSSWRWAEESCFAVSDTGRTRIVTGRGPWVPLPAAQARTHATMATAARTNIQRARRVRIAT